MSAHSTIVSQKVPETTCTHCSRYLASDPDVSKDCEISGVIFSFLKFTRAENFSSFGRKKKNGKTIFSFGNFL